MTRSSDCFLGLDCGTGSTKALLLEAASGRVLGVRSSSHPIDGRADGTSEQDPADWLRATIAAVRAVCDAVAPTHVLGIAVSGQQHGLVALDQADAVVRPAKLWNDTTTQAECDVLTDALGGVEAVVGLTGNRFLTGYTAPKVLWLRRQEPDSYARTRRVCLPHDYLNLWLTGEFVTEPGDASGTAYVDVRTRAYSAPVLAALDPDRDWASTLPPIAASRSVVGQLRADAAEALGLPAGIPVTAGGGDNMCAAIGVGAVSEGPVVVSLGTSATAFTHRTEPAIDPMGEVSAFCDSTGGWLPLACTLNCTGVVSWARSLAGDGAPSAEEALALSPVGARGLTFLPYLSGERTPDLPRASGSLLGLRSDHGAADLVRAAVEGVTFGVAFALDALERTGVLATALTVVGGGSNADPWAQLLADVTALPVRRPAEPEAAAAGAALQARWIISGQAPVEPAADAEWLPRASADLEAARGRLEHARELALSGALA
jgi:xylulokinase